jgi:hypothetical protein
MPAARSGKGRSFIADVHLDGDALDLRGRPALRLPFSTLRRIGAQRGVVHFETEEGPMSLALGGEAERWATAMRYPRARAEKLGLKAEQRVQVIGVEDPDLGDELAAAGATRVSRGKRLDQVFFGVDAERDLERLATLREAIAPDGAIWVIRKKGKDATVKERAVLEAARRHGLVDVKVVAFSDTHSSDKLVIPVAKRR